MPRKESNFLDYVDKEAVACLGGDPMLGFFPMEGNVSGHHRSNHKGSSVEFAEYREYTPGDDPRRIDWRVLARTDRYFLKEFEAETNLRAHHILDCSGSMSFGKPKTKFEFAKSIIGTLSYLYLNQGDAVGLTTIQGKETLTLPARRNPSQLQDILETLGNSKSKGKDQLVSDLHDTADSLKSRGLVVILSDFLEDPKTLKDALHHLRDRKHEVVLFHLLDRQEVDFIFDRPTRFIDLEGGASMLTEPSTIREEYLSQLHAHVSSLKHISIETQSFYHQVMTDQKIEISLKAYSISRTQR